LFTPEWEVDTIERRTKRDVERHFRLDDFEREAPIVVDEVLQYLGGRWFRPRGAVGQKPDRSDLSHVVQGL
jgi:hypothetical protein